VRFTKGHGTGNDFVIVDESVTLTPELVAGLCDRRFGIGGDGVLRVARSGDLYFMDYWNSDGSLSEMCGNGVRVFARYLWETELATGMSIEIATRAGVRTAIQEWNGIRVDMGAPVRLGQSDGGLAVSMGNPHLVFKVDDVADEESVPVEERRARLAAWRTDLKRACENQSPQFPVLENQRILHRG